MSSTQDILVAVLSDGNVVWVTMDYLHCLEDKVRQDPTVCDDWVLDLDQVEVNLPVWVGQVKLLRSRG